MGNEIDIKAYFDVKFDSLREYFDVKFKNMDEKFDTLKFDNKVEHARFQDRLDGHDNEIVNLKNCEGKEARSFLQMIKETAAKWIIPTLLLLIVYGFTSGLIGKLLHIS